MRDSLDQLLAELNTHPVLVDVGASGAPPPIWRRLAPHSVYIGFDPDQRDLRETAGGAFHRSVIVNKAITERDGVNEVRFYFTKQPHCSSTLRPDTESLSDFLFADLFVVEREGSVPAETLNSVLDHIGLDRIDWLKIDTQGTDLRIWRSLREETRASLLAVDIEPGLIRAYDGEDLFVDAHRELTQNGYWLADLKVHGAVRLRPATLKEALGPRATARPSLQHALKRSPAWVEARYLRTVGSLREQRAERRAWLLLWMFALLDKQVGFALDVAEEYRRAFVNDELAQRLWRASAIQLRKRERRAAAYTLAATLPAGAKRFIRKYLS